MKIQNKKYNLDILITKYLLTMYTMQRHFTAGMKIQNKKYNLDICITKLLLTTNTVLVTFYSRHENTEQEV